MRPKKLKDKDLLPKGFNHWDKHRIPKAAKIAIKHCKQVLNMSKFTGVERCSNRHDDTIARGTVIAVVIYSKPDIWGDRDPEVMHFLRLHEITYNYKLQVILRKQDNPDNWPFSDNVAMVPVKDCYQILQTA